MDRLGWALRVLAATLVACDGGQAGSDAAAPSTPEADAKGGAPDVPATAEASVAPDVTADLPVPNTPPVLVDDLVVTEAGVSVEISALYNDADPDGDMLQIVEVTQGTHGVVAILFAGSKLEYTPLDAEYTGTDSFEYVASDGKGGKDSATVTVNIKTPPPLPTLTITSPKDGDVIVGGTVTVVFEVTGCTFTKPGSNKQACHAHKYLDGQGWEGTGSGIGQYVLAPIQVTPLSTGSHTFALVLARNDGTDDLWSPEVSDAVTFEVQ